MVMDRRARQARLRWISSIRNLSLGREVPRAVCDLQEILDDLDRGLTSSAERDWARILRLCGKLKAIAQGRRFHAHLSRLELDRDPGVAMALLGMYCKCESVGEARAAFDGLAAIARSCAVAWSMMIGTYARSGHRRAALTLLKAMLLEGVRPSDVTLISALTACGGPSELRDGVEIHSLARESEASSMARIALGNTLVSMYGKCGSLEDAIAAFRAMDGRDRDRVSWSVIISACARYERCELEVLALFRSMQLEGLSAGSPALGIVVNACARLGALDQGMAIHGSVAQAGIRIDYALGIALINLYGRCGRIEDAIAVFHAVEERTPVSWNSMMAVLVQHGRSRRALELFFAMLQLGEAPTKVTFMTILGACAPPSPLTLARFLHSCVDLCGFRGDVLVANAIVSMYDACGGLEQAETTFREMEERDTVSWNVMISAYIQRQRQDETRALFGRMLLEGVTPDRATLVHVLNAASSSKELQFVHGLIAERGDERHEILGSALVTAHGRVGTLEEARRIFGKLEQRDVVSWNGMIGACARRGEFLEAWEIYQEMRGDGSIVPSSVTFVAMLDACAEAGALDKGRQIHASIPDEMLRSTMEIAVALVALYGKCGKIAEAKLAFDAAGARDVILWSALIAAYAQLGFVRETLLLVATMQQEGLEPNRVTYVSAIAACSHAGLVREACVVFSAMIRDHGLAPNCEHYRCLVDLLARAGELNEAERLAQDSGPLAWMTLLGACQSHGDLGRAHRAAGVAIESDSSAAAGFVALFNTVAVAGEEIELVDRVVTMLEQDGEEINSNGWNMRGI